MGRGSDDGLGCRTGPIVSEYCVVEGVLAESQAQDLEKAPYRISRSLKSSTERAWTHYGAPHVGSLVDV